MKNVFLNRLITLRLLGPTLIVELIESVKMKIYVKKLKGSIIAVLAFKRLC